MGLLDEIGSPEDLRALEMDQLPELAEEVRARILQVVGQRGGHLASNLGITDLTIALHRTFDFVHDHLLWDVGHQCYPHKLLTGRHKRFDTLRQPGGISGFPDIHESAYDLFNVGHAGTSPRTISTVNFTYSSMSWSRRQSASVVNGVPLNR